MITVLQFLRPGQVWQSRASNNRIRVVRVVGRNVVVASLGKNRSRLVIGCDKFRNYYHGYRFVENPDGTAATETPPDPPRCWRCGSWKHVEKVCDKAGAVLSKEGRSA